MLIFFHRIRITRFLTKNGFKRQLDANDFCSPKCSISFSDNKYKYWIISIYSTNQDTSTLIVGGPGFNWLKKTLKK